MIKIKKIIFVFLIFLLYFENVKAGIQDSIYLTIGNKPVTKSDVKDEIKIILILNNEVFSEDKKDQLQKAAIAALIKRTIKKIELEKNSFLKINQDDLKEEVSRLAKSINVNTETFKKICEKNGISFALIKNNLKTELLWNSLVFKLYRNRLAIDADQIEDQLKKIQNKKEIVEYLISEILAKISDKNNLKSEIIELKNKIQNLGFEQTAKNLSMSKSSIKGGDLGWLSEDLISKQFKEAIDNTPVGSLSVPIIIPQGILIFKIRDTKITKKTISLEEAKNQLVNAEKIKILNMHSISHYDKARRSALVKFFNE